MTAASELVIRQLADDRDEAFVLGLAHSFAEGPLPAWRSREESIRGVRASLAQRLLAEHGEATILIAENRSGQPVGFICLSLTRDYFHGQRQCHLNELAVAPAQQRQGYGTALLAHAEDWARAHDCRALSLNVFPDNQKARRLYQRGGYQLDLLRLVRPL